MKYKNSEDAPKVGDQVRVTTRDGETAVGEVSAKYEASIGDDFEVTVVRRVLRRDTLYLVAGGEEYTVEKL